MFSFDRDLLTECRHLAPQTKLVVANSEKQFQKCFQSSAPAAVGDYRKLLVLHICASCHPTLCAEVAFTPC